MSKAVIRTAVHGALAFFTLTGSAFAQNGSLEQVSRDLAEIKAKNERLAAEVEYLKEHAKAQRKDAAKETVEVETLKTNTGKFTWSGDFRYRNEQIQTAPNSITDEHTQGRDRIRMRLGVTAKINDTVTGRFQISTAANNDPRSTNQTLGESWTRKSVGLDLAYVDWKPVNSLSLQVGKMPQPWTRTAGYLWDGDITPEGVALRFARGSLFANGFYDWLNERHSATGLRADTKLVGGQIGLRQPLGTATLTVAAAYFDLQHVRGEQVQANAGSCTAFNAAFFGNSAQGNATSQASDCTRLWSDFDVANGLAQFDFLAGRFPMSVFVDYMKNLGAETHPIVGEKLDTAYSAGITFNRASNPMTWEVALIYQQSEADAVFGQFHDSDFGGGRTDTDGFVVKLGFVPAPSWTLNATLFLNEQNNDTGAVAPATGASTVDVTYKRLQLDLNFKF